MEELHSEASDLGSISQWILSAKAGDDAAKEAICREVQQYLLNAAARLLSQSLNAKLNPSDVVQWTMTRMIQRIDDFRGSSTAEFYGWLQAILQNEIRAARREYVRQKRDVRREQRLEGESPDGSIGIAATDLTPARLVIRQEKLARLHHVLACLPADYREVIMLRSLEDLPFSEVAERMERSHHSVTKLWYRAIVKLQQELERLDESIH